MGKVERAAKEKSIEFLDTVSISAIRVTTQWGTLVVGSSSLTTGPDSRIYASLP